MLLHYLSVIWPSRLVSLPLQGMLWIARKPENLGTSKTYIQENSTQSQSAGEGKLETGRPQLLITYLA